MNIKGKLPNIPVYGFIIVSLMIGLSDGFFVWINARSAWNEVLESARVEAAHVEKMFHVALDNVSTSMQAIATYVASDPETARLFYEGKLAVEAEGGGPGGAGASLARDRLHQAIRPGWEAMRSRYNARQLHFHLGPGSTSFLRAHRPDKYGDNMDNVRHTIVDANRKGIPTKGFETGRVYSGIRGVVPVMHRLENGTMVQAGALEAGASFSTVLNSLNRGFDASFAVFLTKEHMDDNMWPFFLEKRYRKTPPVGGFVLESATNSTAYELLKTPEAMDTLDTGRTNIMDMGETSLATSSFTFRDYEFTRDHKDDFVGKVFFWRDISPEVAAYEKTMRFNIAFATAAFLVIEILLIASWRFASRKLRNMVETRTSELNRANQDLTREIAQRKRAQENYRKLFDNVPIGIFQSEPGGGFLTANTEAAHIYGYDSPRDLMDSVTSIRDQLFEDPELYDKLQSDLLAAPEVRDMEAVIVRKGGDKLWTTRSVRATADGKDHVVIDGFIRDISSRKKLEQLREDLESITRHDLKSPIVGIINGLALLEMSGPCNDEQTMALELIREKAYQTLDMIGRSMDLYKMERGAYSLQFTHFDLLELFQRIRFDNQDVIRGKQSSLDMFRDGKPLSEGEEFLIIADESLCYSIFSNIVRNGLEACETGTGVRVDLSRNREWTSARIESRSTVPEDIRDTFFDKYVTRDKAGGTGLGTYSAKLMTEYQGGGIELDCSVTGATTLTVRLPANPMKRRT